MHKDVFGSWNDVNVFSTNPNVAEMVTINPFMFPDSIHVLEHVEDLKWQVAQLQRLIKKDGRIVIAVPNYKSYDAEYYKEKWAAYDVPRHLNHFNKETLSKIFKTNGLTLVKTDKLRWDAYYISYMSEQYRHHNFPLIRGIYRGWVSNCKARKSKEWSSKVYVFEKQKTEN